MEKENKKMKEKIEDTNDEHCNLNLVDNEEGSAKRPRYTLDLNFSSIEQHEMGAPSSSLSEFDPSPTPMMNPTSALAQQFRFSNTNDTGSGSQRPIPNVGNLFENSDLLVRQMQQSPHPMAKVTAALLHSSQISGTTPSPMTQVAAAIFQSSQRGDTQPSDASDESPPMNDIMWDFQIDMNNNILKRFEELQSELADYKHRFLLLETRFNNMNPSEGQISNDDTRCDLAGQATEMGKSGKSILSVDEIPSSTNVLSKGPVITVAGEGLSAENTDRNKEATEADETQDDKEKSNASQDDNTQEFAG